MLVYTQCRNDFHNDSKCRKKLTQCKYHKTTRVHCGGNYLYYMWHTYDVTCNQRPSSHVSSHITGSPVHSLQITKPQKRAITAPDFGLLKE